MTELQSKIPNPAAWLAIALAVALLGAPSAWARSSALSVSDVARVSDRAPSDVVAVPVDDLPVVVVDRDQLADDIRPRPDVDTADTALLFTNRTGRVVEVRCLARGYNGHIVGYTHTTVPARGLRYIRASDFSDGRDFVGSAECKSNGRATATAVLFGAEITDLRAESRRRGRGMSHFFPVVATY